MVEIITKEKKKKNPPLLPACHPPPTGPPQFSNTGGFSVRSGPVLHGRLRRFNLPME